MIGIEVGRDQQLDQPIMWPSHDVAQIAGPVSAASGVTVEDG